MWSRVPRAALAALASGALVAALAACADEPGRTPVSTPVTPPSSEATGTPTATVEPAAGEMLEVAALRLHLTEGPRWLKPPAGMLTVSATYVSDTGLPVTITLSDLSAVQTDLEADAAAFLQVSKNDPRPHRTDNRVVAGVEVWAAEGSNAELHSSWIGGIHDGRQWTVQIETPVDLDGADRLREQVIASITWK
ncbi:hypothetical protein [Nocardioides sp. L-11A]|uniref:hypothetical protein n=1 Tax=Nocardioides sp. L-11A TaxID=3043848 RepID=UPI002499BAF9|nr:hypothetical protein QJ852_20145 [Nocardioides sp. L-11A]